MALKTSHRVFFAIPFDSTTKEMYGDIASRLKERYNVTSVFGNMEISPSPEYSEIVSFKAQNSDLVTQIKSEIEKADVIVADLTQNNPNVHVELGIGLYLNKNILRVTGRSLTELG